MRKLNYTSGQVRVSYCKSRMEPVFLLRFIFTSTASLTGSENDFKSRGTASVKFLPHIENETSRLDFSSKAITS